MYMSFLYSWIIYENFLKHDNNKVIHVVFILKYGALDMYTTYEVNIYTSECKNQMFYQAI